MSEVRRQAVFIPRPNWGWQDDAACRGKEVVLFFGPDGERQPEREIRERKAKAVCAACPVRAECLNYAVSRPEKYGTWGGLNEDEPSAERRRRMRRANAACPAGPPSPPCGVDNGDMICLSCRQQHHEKCPGGTWCDCQHRQPDLAAEPQLGWIRQG